MYIEFKIKVSCVYDSLYFKMKAFLYLRYPVFSPKRSILEEVLIFTTDWQKNRQTSHENSCKPWASCESMSLLYHHFVTLETQNHKIKLT